MSTNPHRITLGRIDYDSTFRFTRLFDCFRMAISPTRLMLALMLIACLFIAGLLMNQLWGPRVIVDPHQPMYEFTHFIQQPTGDFLKWRDGRIDSVTDEHRQGIFTAVFETKLTLFEHLVRAAVNLRPGFDQLAPGTPPTTDSVLGTLRLLFMVPLWLWHAHTSFFVVYMLLFLLGWSLFGGAISRSAIVEAAGGSTPGATDAFVYAWRRWLWYILAPLMPLLIIAGLGGLLALGGVVFNVWVLDILGGLFFALALAIGFLMALLLIGWIGGVHLMYPALSAEDSDAFDAMSRGYSYVLARPWRLILYTFISLIYGAVTYLFVGVFIFVTIYLTHWAIGLLVFGAFDGGTYFNALFPPPQFGDLTRYRPDYEHLNWSGSGAATLIMCWVFVLIGVVGAYALNFYLCSYSVIYLLLRRYTDGTDPAEIADPDAARPPADKIEPASVSPAPAVPASTSTPKPPAPDIPDEQ
jgi:hypothetical protein